MADSRLEAVSGETPFQGVVAEHGLDDAVIGFNGDVVIAVQGGKVGILGE